MIAGKNIKEVYTHWSGGRTAPPGARPHKRELKRKRNNLQKVLHSGYSDAVRENLPRLLCPLQNARSPKHSASRLWNRTDAPPSTQGGGHAIRPGCRQQLKAPLRLCRLCIGQNTKGF